MRATIRQVIARDPSLRVVGEAADAYEARTLIKATDPDVVTLDIEMPRMNGLAFLEKVMRLRPMPVIMVSSLTDRGCDAAVEAMSIGAVDCVVKPTPANPHSLEILPEKIRVASKARIPSRPAAPAAAPREPAGPYRRMIAIGASTGGVEALTKILTGFPAQCPPTLIVQHMPGHFTAKLARRLDSRCAMRVVEARQGDPIAAGTVYLAPGSDYHLALSSGPPFRCRLVEGPTENGHRPSVDRLFTSMMAAAPNVVGALLTGMGTDGARGLKALSEAGCSTLVQDRESCVVYGMPKAALELGTPAACISLDNLARQLLSEASRAISP